MFNLTYSEQRALKKELLILFKELSVYRNNDGDSVYEAGICYKKDTVVYELFGHSKSTKIINRIISNFFKTACKSWDKYSGNCAFPIPSKISETEAYLNFKKWGNSKYADDRRDLAKYCYQYFKENFYPEIEL